MIQALVLAALLPASLQPPPPFPAILTDAPSFSAVAPGVEYGIYHLQTHDGPIAVHALAIAPHEPDISLETVLSQDALTSPGETLSSMAHRTGAIAGINGDYFDIGNTNRPTNIVVRSGTLIHTPSKRYALLITSDGPQIAQDAFSGTVWIGTRAVTLDAINEFPPPGGNAALITPLFGTLPERDDVALIRIEPEAGTPPFCSYRVLGVADNTVSSPPGYYLAVGRSAYDPNAVPLPGAMISVNGQLTPVPLAHLIAAVGGGPLLLDDGLPAADPDGPSGAEFLLPIPSSGAALSPDGTLFLIQVDGREPDGSIGVTRSQFASLMRAFGAVRGMAFDGGGSSELVAQTATQTQAVVQNQPSDGRERKIADGLLIYDTASAGPPSQIAVSPSMIHAMPSARVALRVAFADASDRVVGDAAPVDIDVEPAALGKVEAGAFVASQPGTGRIVFRSGSFTREIPVEVSADPARVDILPRDPNAAANGTVTLRAQAFDAQGYALALPPSLPWRALHAAIDPSGTLRAGTSNALVSLLLGDHVAEASVSVGYHDEPLPVLLPRAMTVPRNQAASVAERDPCAQCTSLSYELSSSERAAYLVLEAPLPPQTVAIGFDVFDDGSGGLLKLALRNAIDEDVLLAAGPLVHRGWRSVDVRLPADLAQPARLTAIYVIGARAGTSARGTIAIRGLHAVLAGTGGTRH